MNEMLNKVKEVFISVFPVTLIVFLIHFIWVPLSSEQIESFSVGAFLVLIGLSIFLSGIDESIDPIGHKVGRSLTRTNSLALVITVSLILGFFISFAEPDLHILAQQVDKVTAGQFPKNLMVVVVSIGLGVMMTLGQIRILYSIPLQYVFLLAYGIIAILSLLSSREFLAIAFDASGATTGAITVPFLLALAGGVSAMKKRSDKSEVDAFGLVGIASSGAIIGVLLTGLIMGVEKLGGELPVEAVSDDGILKHYLHLIPQTLWESLMSLGPILIAYLIFYFVDKPRRKSEFISIFRGMFFTYIGLSIFLLGVYGGFMDVGSYLGVGMGSLDSKVPALLVGFILGLVTVLAEPAVYVLTHQVEDVTGGYVRRPLVLAFLSVAVGLAIFLSILRILVPGIQLWMFLLPGFGISVIAAFMVPELFVGIAFDAGGVASGPMTATFALAFVQGLSRAVPGADVIVDGFGMIAIVAAMPILSLQLLGIIYKQRTKHLEKGKQKES